MEITRDTLQHIYDQLVEEQVYLSLDEQAVLYNNLWELYGDDE